MWFPLPTHRLKSRWRHAWYAFQGRVTFVPWGVITPKIVVLPDNTATTCKLVQPAGAWVGDSIDGCQLCDNSWQVLSKVGLGLHGDSLASHSPLRVRVCMWKLSRIRKNPDIYPLLLYFLSLAIRQLITMKHWRGEVDNYVTDNFNHHHAISCDWHFWLLPNTRLEIPRGNNFLVLLHNVHLTKSRLRVKCDVCF